MSKDNNKYSMIAFRLDAELADTFKQLSKQANRTPSVLLRDFVIEYVSKNDKRCEKRANG